MDTFLRGFLHALERRATVIRDRLAAIPFDPDLSAHALDAYQEAESLRREAANLLGDPTLGVPTLLGNHLRVAQEIEQRAALVESYALPFLERYDDRDRRLTRLCARLATQVAWPLPPPLVHTSSNQYYWTLAKLNLICVPAVDDASLLRWPDLCHELGHILMDRHAAVLVGPFLPHLVAYIESEKRRVRNLQRPVGYVALYDRLLAQWLRSWVLEFVGDVVATYLVGPAFGWQHIQLCAGGGKLVYLPALADISTHPADEARLRGIITTLTAMGAPGTPELGAALNTYITLSGQVLPPDYNVCYPDTLLSRLAQTVVAGCRSLGLRGYDVIPSPDKDVAALIGEAWIRFRADSASYGAWEQVELERLWNEILP